MINLPLPLAVAHVDPLADHLGPTVAVQEVDHGLPKVPPPRPILHRGPRVWRPYVCLRDLPANIAKAHGHEVDLLGGNHQLCSNEISLKEALNHSG